MSHKHGFYLEDLSIDMTASLEKTITATDVAMFASLSGDNNPIHLDEEYAKSTSFGARIVHGMFSAALISAVAGTKLPGPGGIYLSQNLKFRKPIFIDDTVVASLTITDINERRGRVTMRTDVHVGDKLVVSGEAVYMVDKRPTV
ncbi:MAG: MaoC family dehydratase [Oceanospirillaceae bacterium]|nr:MaoC family dehydratase [Oceanospirillaceae bacterium]NRB43100.1 MaoC family dehydratase [Pseudomonadales bacterium]